MWNVKVHINCTQVLNTQAHNSPFKQAFLIPKQALTNILLPTQRSKIHLECTILPCKSAGFMRKNNAVRFAVCTQYVNIGRKKMRTHSNYVAFPPKSLRCIDYMQLLEFQLFWACDYIFISYIHTFEHISHEYCVHDEVLTIAMC